MNEQQGQHDFQPFLAVYVVWHPGSTEATELARLMFTTFCADPHTPALRGLGIPVKFRTSKSSEEVPDSIPFGKAMHTVVFILADDNLAAEARWSHYADGVVASALSADLVIPVILTAAANLPPGLASVQGIPRLEGVQWETEVLNHALHDVCRVLEPSAEKVRVFLSHSKHDGLGVTTEVRRYLRETAHLDEFFDAADIPDGTRFSEFLIGCAGSLPCLLAVQTDTYASREWCRLEVLEAKRRQVPIVVLTALRNREQRSFPYMGNVPVVRWNEGVSLPVLVRELLIEVLRKRYFPKRVEALWRQRGLTSSYQVLTSPPELVTSLMYRAETQDSQLGNLSRICVYPDPPLGTEELDLLLTMNPELNPVTPTMLLAL